MTKTTKTKNPKEDAKRVIQTVDVDVTTWKTREQETK